MATSGVSGSARNGLPEAGTGAIGTKCESLVPAPALPSRGTAPLGLPARLPPRRQRRTPRQEQHEPPSRPAAAPGSAHDAVGSAGDFPALLGAQQVERVDADVTELSVHLEPMASPDDCGVALDQHPGLADEDLAIRARPARQLPEPLRVVEVPQDPLTVLHAHAGEHALGKREPRVPGLVLQPNSKRSMERACASTWATSSRVEPSA